MIKNIDRTTARKIDITSSDSVSINLLITNKDKSTEHRTFRYTKDFRFRHINYVTRSVLNDLFHFDTFGIVADAKCPQNIVDRSIKFCKKYGADFLFAIAGIRGVTVYIKKHKKSKIDYFYDKWYIRYNQYFWRKYQIVWTIVEV